MTQAIVLEKAGKEMELPVQFVSYIKEKVEKNGSGGRPHFVAEVAKKGMDPKEVVLDIVEYAWMKNRSPRSLARKYKTGYLTIYRLLQDLEAFKEDLVKYLEIMPRRKVFWNRDLDTSDYETVQAYIKRAKQPPYVRRYKDRLRQAVKVWKAFGYKDPQKWTKDEVLQFLETKTDCSASGYLDSIRIVAPQIADKNSAEYIGTGFFRDRIPRRKKDIFKPEMKMIFEALRAKEMDYHETILKLHVQLGAREGTDGKAGMVFLKWSFFKKGFTRVDIYESKTKGGMWCRNCPLDHLFRDLPQRLHDLWVQRGKPTEEPVLLGGYSELLGLYKDMRKALKEYWKGKIDPSLLKEFSSMKPHDSDKLHCNLYWEAKVPIEVLAGQYLGQGEGMGLCGRVWLSVETIRKHYLSLTQRSERFKEIEKNVHEYAKDFNGGVHA